MTKKTLNAWGYKKTYKEGKNAQKRIRKRVEKN